MVTICEGLDLLLGEAEMNLRALDEGRIARNMFFDGDDFRHKYLYQFETGACVRACLRAFVRTQMMTPLGMHMTPPACARVLLRATTRAHIRINACACACVSSYSACD